MTGTTLPQSIADRETTVMSFSGGSPPRSTVTVSPDKTVCPNGHSLQSPTSYYVTDSGRHACIQCRIDYATYLIAKIEAERPVRDLQLAEEKAMRIAERRQRLEARRTTRRMLVAASEAGRVRVRIVRRRQKRVTQ